jgi:putative phosphoribosyl transferase
LTRQVHIPVGDASLVGDLSRPGSSEGLVLFVHGSGSSRLSSRNRLVAARLNQHGLATLLFDLLTGEEEQIDMVSAQLRFDIGLLTDRVDGAIRFVESDPELGALGVGLFGASTGAAAAIAASLRHKATVKAVVSRGGRPDLAGDALSSLAAPTLLIVGSLDDVVIDLNQKAFEAMSCEKRLEIVEGASHLFEEPGKLETVASLAADWFGSHLSGSR